MASTLSRRSTKPKTYHHGNLKAAFLEAAQRLIKERGPESLTLRACAREAGVSHGASAHHFVNLAGLFTALAIDGFEKLLLSMEADDAGDCKEPLLAAALGYIRFAMNSPEQFRIMWRGDLLDEETSHLQELKTAARELLQHALEHSCPLSKGKAPHELLLAARFNLAWCCVHGYACLWVEGPRKQESLSDAEQMLKLLRPSLSGISETLDG